MLSLTLDVDKSLDFDTPSKTFSAIKLERYLRHVNDPANKAKYAYMTREEKELLYGYKSLSEDDRLEIRTLINLKLQRKFIKKKQ